MSNKLILPIEYKQGCRVMLLKCRHKEGGTNEKHDRSATKRVTTSPEEFDKCYNELVDIAEHADMMMRIYLSVNSRNIDKAIHRFRTLQLDADLYDINSRYDFYIDIRNRFISSLMQPSSRVDTKFLIDIDDKDVAYRLDKLKELGVDICNVFETKNGYHIITKPFNPSKWDNSWGNISKDALTLIYYK